MRNAKFAAALIGTIWLAAGHQVAAAGIEPGPWRFVISSPIGDMPFNVDLSRSGEAWTATLINGPERIDAETTTVAGDTLTIAFPSYDSRLSGALDGETLRGAITFNSAHGSVDVPFTARHGEAFRFSPKPTEAKIDLSGTWAVTALAPDGKTATHGIGEFTQNGTAVDGSVIYVNADTRFLNGELSGDTLALSTFDGGYGTLWTAQVQPDGSLKGKSFLMGAGLVTAWSAVRR